MAATADPGVSRALLAAVCFLSYETNNLQYAEPFAECNTVPANEVVAPDTRTPKVNRKTVAIVPTKWRGENCVERAFI